MCTLVTNTFNSGPLVKIFEESNIIPGNMERKRYFYFDTIAKCVKTTNFNLDITVESKISVFLFQIGIGIS